MLQLSKKLWTAASKVLNFSAYVALCGQFRIKKCWLKVGQKFYKSAQINPHDLAEYFGRISEGYAA